ncbi:MAG: NAD-dependent epimerase/dehydratase family protein, partial [Aquabacterium sp.]
LAGMPEQCPVIILGGKGTIGSRVVALLQQASDRPVCAIDVDNQAQFPSHFKGQAVIVLNITKLGALSQYIPQLWPEAIVLNEVYPEPKRAELGPIRCWHIAGVQGGALPAFRGAYADALPCCAAYLQGDQFDVVLRQIA